jgi:DNA-directed RNA polymerase subunit K/omega
MTAPKAAAHNEGAFCNPSGASVYELAIAAAKEAKRINERFYEAKKTPPNNVVLTALKRVAEGRVAYRMQADESGKPQDEPGNGGNEKGE